MKFMDYNYRFFTAYALPNQFSFLFSIHIISSASAGASAVVITKRGRPYTTLSMFPITFFNVTILDVTAKEYKSV